jgi:trans-aconitate 2-methyltransferase
MLLHAREDLHADFGSRAGFVAADLVALPFTNCFDGIFSTASFHWVPDHLALFRSLYEVLLPKGWLHAQCGGGPNLQRLRRRVRELSQKDEFSQWLGNFQEPWFFSDAEEAASNLHAAGFENVETGLERADFNASNADEFQQCLRTFVLHRHLEIIPIESLRSSLLQQLTEASARDNPPWSLDYWRLNLRALKSASG